METIQEKLSHARNEIKSIHDENAILIKEKGAKGVKDFFVNSNLKSVRICIAQLDIIKWCYSYLKEGQKKKVTDKQVSEFLNFSETKCRQYRHIFEDERKMELLFITNFDFARSLGSNKLDNQHFDKIISLLEKYGENHSISEFKKLVKAEKEEARMKNQGHEEERKTISPMEQLKNEIADLKNKNDEQGKELKTVLKEKESIIEKHNREIAELKKASDRGEKRYIEILEDIANQIDYESMKNKVKFYLSIASIQSQYADPMMVN